MATAILTHTLAQTDDGWEVFDRRSAGRMTDRLRIGIDKSGKFVLSRMALDAIGGHRNAFILIDRRGRRIALRGTTEDPNAFKVTGTTRQVYARQPLLDLGYDYTAGSSWVTPRVEGDLLIINLAEAEANRKGQS